MAPAFDESTATPSSSCVISDYELQRNARLSQNQKRMQALGLVELSRSLSGSSPPSTASTRGHKLLKGSTGAQPTRVPVDTSQLPRRRSSRLLGTTLPCYTEVSTVKEHKEVIDTRQIQPEIYTEEHEKLLGSCNEDWELFKDGFAADGTRIYDSERGKTCHQCRQKTLGLRTSCSQCKSLRGKFCGDCLFMRYGENVIEANKNMEWVCPVCRGICNCSFCRIKKGWAPTGSMYRLALKLNYKSVAHYLIMTRRGSSDVQSKEVENEPNGASKIVEVDEEISNEALKADVGKEGIQVIEHSDEPAGVRRSLRYV